jgi:hypothetical protein
MKSFLDVIIGALVKLIAFNVFKEFFSLLVLGEKKKVFPLSFLVAVQIIPASVQSATPTTIKVINSSAKAAKVQRAPRISGEDRSSPGNRTGIFALTHIYKFLKIRYVLSYHMKM